MGGGLMQLVAYGAQDIYLTGNPQITFFKVVYRRHTNFSMECIRQTFKGTVGPGNRVVATISRNGDLVHDCFIKVPPRDLGSAQYNPGYNMINNIEVEIGGQQIDKHYGHWMEAHAELTEKNVGPQNSTVGGYIASGSGSLAGFTVSAFQSTALAGGIQLGSVKVGEINVPLRFWFCRHVGLALPLIALQYHEVNIIVNFTSTGPTDASLWCNYIYLDTDERRRFAQVSHEYLIEQIQMQEFTGETDGDTLKLNFNHPVKELVWVGIGNGEAGTAVWGIEDSVSGKFSKLSASRSIQHTWQLKLNGHDRFEKQDISYFTAYQPYKYHNSIGSIQDSVGVYSFALKPEEHQPSGTCNFSRIDNSQLIYSKLPDKTNLYVYAVNYNVLRIMSGMGGLAYSN